MSKESFEVRGMGPALLAAAAVLSLATSSGAVAQTTITIESWRYDDAAIWNEQIIPAFERAHPDINVEFKPTQPPGYTEALIARLESGAAGDLITRRPFDPVLDLYERGYLAPLNDLPGIGSPSDVAASGCTTDDGATLFCVPIASVMHGFIYNTQIFEELGLSPPATVAEFHAVLDAIREDGTYIPLALGTADQWEAATMGFQNIGPTYWLGEQGRRALLASTGRFTDQAYLDAFAELASWGPYLSDGQRTQGYEDSLNIFALGQAAIYPAGSWEIAALNAQGDVPFSVFPPPAAAPGGTCYVTDHPDIAIGLNAASPNAEAARIFLTWVTSAEFATIYANALPGYFPLASMPFDIEDSLARSFLEWREDCERTVRNSYQTLSRGTPNLEDELWRVSAQVINGTMAPEEAAAQIQAGLDSWYTPAQ